VAKTALLALTVLALLASGCMGDQASAPADTAKDAPKSLSNTRAVILAAAEAGDYERLRPVLDQDVFLSDWGFGSDGPDPVRRWQELGPEPLKTMGALLRMPHIVRETNEGTLHEWPRFTPDSTAKDVTEAERELFLSFMSEDELRQAFNPDYGYTAPRLGILADGTWWFFIVEPGP
jgi:hypothetical protein